MENRAEELRANILSSNLCRQIEQAGFKGIVVIPYGADKMFRFEPTKNFRLGSILDLLFDVSQWLKEQL